MNYPLDLLCVGHCCHDVVKDGHILGGSSSYASLISKALGFRPAILTSVGDDFKFNAVFEEKEIPFFNVRAEKTTVFDNKYEGQTRTQYILNRANSIRVYDVPEEVKKVPVILLGSIAKEIDFGLIQYFRNSLVGCILQGLIRDWDHDGLVFSSAIDWNKLAGIDVAFLSDDDLKGMEAHLDDIKQVVPHIVLTHGKNGASIFYNNEVFRFNAFPVKEMDATGAGDAFSTAYLLKFHQTYDIAQSAIFAHCVASIIVEGIGLNNIQLLSTIEERVNDYHQIFTDLGNY